MNSFNAQTLHDFLLPLKAQYIHASNILTKLQKTTNKQELAFLLDCGQRYKAYHDAFQITGDYDLDAAVEAWNRYEDFVQKHNLFSAQSKFEPNANMRISASCGAVAA